MAEHYDVSEEKIGRYIKAIRLASSPNFYNSREWREVRYEVLREYGAQCQCCGRTAKDGCVMHVDHIKPRYFHPHLALEKSNLQILCDDCNIGKGARDATDWRSQA